MKTKEHPTLLANYDGHISYFTESAMGGPNRKITITSNQGKFNPDGHWRTANAMRRWANTHIHHNARGRILNWVDVVLDAHTLNKHTLNDY